MMHQRVFFEVRQTKKFAKFLIKKKIWLQFLWIYTFILLLKDKWIEEVKTQSNKKKLYILI